MIDIFSVLGSLLICIASAVTLITAMSLSAICTNGEVKGGGLYYLVRLSDYQLEN